MLHALFANQHNKGKTAGVVALLEKASQSTIDKIYGKKIEGQTLIEAAFAAGYRSSMNNDMVIKRFVH